jgi:hypothetical protein
MCDPSQPDDVRVDAAHALNSAVDLRSEVPPPSPSHFLPPQDADWQIDDAAVGVLARLLAAENASLRHLVASAIGRLPNSGYMVRGGEKVVAGMSSWLSSSEESLCQAALWSITNVVESSDRLRLAFVASLGANAFEKIIARVSGGDVAIQVPPPSPPPAIIFDSFLS